MTGDDQRTLSELRKRRRARRLEAARGRPFTDKLLCGNGWIPIILDFVLAAEKFPCFVLISAREKWGALDLDYEVDRLTTAAVRQLELAAVEESSRTCEVCEADGLLRREGWWKTLCDRHSFQRRHDISEEEYGRLIPGFSAAADRWQPMVQACHDASETDTEIVNRFLVEFDDLSADVGRFWAWKCADLVKAKGG